MRHLTSLIVIAFFVGGCTDVHTLRPSAPYDGVIRDLATVCHDPLWRSITPQGLIYPRACPPPNYGSSYKEIYHSAFPSPGCCLVDLLADAPKGLVEGKSHFEKSGSADVTTGAVSLTAPSNIDPDPTNPELVKLPAVGFFRSGLDFGSDAIFSVFATFRNPNGPWDELQPWAVTVTVREGNAVDDLYDAKRISATLRFKQGSATFNVGAGADPKTKPPPIDIGTTTYGQVRNGAPFTIELYVDRKVGKGTAYLIKDGWTLLVFNFDLASDLSGVVLTSAGAGLADCCVTKAALSVDVSDFRILAVRP